MSSIYRSSKKLIFIIILRLFIKCYFMFRGAKAGNIECLTKLGLSHLYHYNLTGIFLFVMYLQFYIEYHQSKFLSDKKFKSFQTFQILLFERNGQNCFQVNLFFSSINSDCFSIINWIVFVVVFSTRRTNQNKVSENKLCDSKYS